MADIKKNVNVNVKTTGAKKATKELENLNDGIKKTNKGSRTLDRNMKGNSQMSANASKNFSKQAQGMQGVLVPAYAEVAARVFALTAAYTALEKAADFSILLRGQQLYAQQTGRNLGIVAKQIQEASGFMLDFKQASSSAGLAGTAGLGTDQIIRMTSAARDASVALGRNLTDAFDRLTRGIVKGEPEILDEIGVLIRLDKVYKDYADTLGTTSNALTENQKLQARYNAIIGQAEGKFGGIGAEAGINQFSRLGAAASDAFSNIGTVIDTVFKPAAAFLADFRESLFLIFALVTKSLIGKIFPAFAEMGKKFDDFAKKSQGTARQIKSNFKDTLETIKSQTAGIVGSKYTTKGVERAAGDLNLKTGKGVLADLGAGKSAAAVKKLENYIKGAREQIQKFGKVSRGTFAGKSAADIDKFEKKVLALKEQLNAAGNAGTRLGTILKLVGNVGVAAFEAPRLAVTSFASAILDTARTTKGMIADLGFLRGTATSVGVAIKTGFAGGLTNIQAMATQTTFLGKTMLLLKTAGVATMGSIKVATTLATAAMQGLSIATSKLLGLFSVLSIGAFVGDLIMGKSGVVSAMRKASSDLADNVGSALESINVNEKKLNKNLQGTFTRIVASEQFKKNLTVQLSQSFSAAVKAMELETDGATVDALSKFIDKIFSKFGQGMADKMAESVAKGIKAIQKLGGKPGQSIADGLSELVSRTYPKEIFGEQAKIFDGIIARLREGTATNQDIKQVDTFLSNMDPEIVKEYVKNLDAQYQLLEKAQNKIANASNEASAALEKFNKAMTDFQKSVQVKTSFDDLADAFNNVLKGYQAIRMQGSTEAGALFLEEQLGIERLTQGTKEYVKAIHEVEQQQIRVNKIRAGILTGNIADEELKLQQKVALRNEKSQPGNFVFPNLQAFRKSYVDARGSDPVAAQEREVTLITEKVRVQQKMGVLTKQSVKELQMSQNFSLRLLKIEKERLENQRANITDKSSNAYLQLTEKIDNKNREIKINKADTLEIEKMRASLLYKELTYAQKLSIEMAKIAESNQAVLPILEGRIGDQQTKVNNAVMKDITDAFAKAFENIADSFGDSVGNKIQAYLTGDADKVSIKQAFGKSMLESGSEIIGNMAKEAVFGRTGFIGTMMTNLGLGGLMDSIIPKTQLEVQQEILKVLIDTYNFNAQKESLPNKIAGGLMQNVGGMAADWLFSLFGNGGIAKGGFKMYANGGIATQPHVGMIGEGKYNEAIVPLPDGKSIPVIGNPGGATNNVTVNVSVDSNGNGNANAQGEGGNMKELGYQLSQIVQEELVKQQRPGGLLSSY